MTLIGSLVPFDKIRDRGGSSRACRSQRRRNSWATSSKTSSNQRSAVEGDDADLVTHIGRSTGLELPFEVGGFVIGFAPSGGKNRNPAHAAVIRLWHSTCYAWAAGIAPDQGNTNAAKRHTPLRRRCILLVSQSDVGVSENLTVLWQSAGGCDTSAKGPQRCRWGPSLRSSVQLGAAAPDLECEIYLKHRAGLISDLNYGCDVPQFQPLFINC